MWPRMDFLDLQQLDRVPNGWKVPPPPPPPPPPRKCGNSIYLKIILRYHSISR